MKKIKRKSASIPHLPTHNPHHSEGHSLQYQKKSVKPGPQASSPPVPLSRYCKEDKPELADPLSSQAERMNRRVTYPTMNARILIETLIWVYY